MEAKVKSPEKRNKGTTLSSRRLRACCSLSVVLFNAPILWSLNDAVLHEGSRESESGGGGGGIVRGARGSHFFGLPRRDVTGKKLGRNDSAGE